MKPTTQPLKVFKAFFGDCDTNPKGIALGYGKIYCVPWYWEIKAIVYLWAVVYLVTVLFSPFGFDKDRQVYARYYKEKPTENNIKDLIVEIENGKFKV